MRNENYYDPGYGVMYNQFQRGKRTAFTTIKNQLGLYDLTEKIVSGTVTKLVKKQTDSLKQKFGQEFKFTSRDSQGVIKWIAAHDSKLKSHISNPQVLDSGITKQALDMVSIENTDFFIPLDEATFAYVSTYDRYHKYSNFIVTNNNESDNNMTSGIGDMTIYIFGRHMKKYVKEISKYTNIKTADMCQYIVMGSSNRDEFSITAKELNPRPLDSLFFDEDIKGTITTHIDKWLDNEQLYADRSLLFKTGILLYGEPGTGKSSLAVALASAYNMEIININMPSFQNIDIEHVIDSINADKNKYIVLLEEIDCVFNTNREDGQTDKDDKKFISDLLQFIDSSKSPNNVIFIATTNYPDKLDSALTRKGRFDLQVEVKSLSSKEHIAEMCKSFNLEQDQIDDIFENITLPVAQSTLQYEILQRIKNQTINETYDFDDENESCNGRDIVFPKGFKFKDYMPRARMITFGHDDPTDTWKFVDNIPVCQLDDGAETIELTLYNNKGYWYVWVSSTIENIYINKECLELFSDLTSLRKIVLNDDIKLVCDESITASEFKQLFTGSNKLTKESISQFYKTENPTVEI